MSTIYEVGAATLCARTGQQSWCIGNLLPAGGLFRLEGGTEHWAWGFAFGGSFTGYCWVQKKWLRPHPRVKEASRGVRSHIGDFAAAWTLTHGILNPGHAHPHLTVHVRVKSEGATLFGNYWQGFRLGSSSTSPFGDGFRNPLFKLHPNHGLGWRYTTNDRLAAMVYDHHNRQWGFVDRHLVETPERDKYYFKFLNDPEKRDKHNHYIFQREPSIVNRPLA
jgi:hypothetical protein